MALVAVPSEADNDSTHSKILPQKKKRLAIRSPENVEIRVRGTRIYDPVNGRSCHWCRQKTLEQHVKCSKCSIHFCGRCLKNRHGEDISIETEEGNRWICPKCRNGCGPACDNCCNCGPCRRARGLAPTGQIVQHAKKAGFSNVHDFLIHIETAESPHQIFARKFGRGWSKTGFDHFSNVSSVSNRMRGALTQEQLVRLGLSLSSALDYEKQSEETERKRKEAEPRVDIQSEDKPKEIEFKGEENDAEAPNEGKKIKLRAVKKEPSEDVNVSGEWQERSFEKNQSVNSALGQEISEGSVVRGAAFQIGGQMDFIAKLEIMLQQASDLQDARTVLRELSKRLSVASTRNRGREDLGLETGGLAESSTQEEEVKPDAVANPLRLDIQT